MPKLAKNLPNRTIHAVNEARERSLADGYGGAPVRPLIILGPQKLAANIPGQPGKASLYRGPAPVSATPPKKAVIHAAKIATLKPQRATS